MQSGRQQATTASKRLVTEYRQLTRNGDSQDMFIAGPIDENNMFEWEAYIKGPDETPFEGGVFCARLSFPRDYPLNPPKMRFDPPLLHPNSRQISFIPPWTSAEAEVYADGNVCISILHSPGDDPNHYELASERWSPVQNVNSILLSVLSMLAEPNVESGANIDACKIYRDDRTGYEKTVRNFVRQQLDLPAL